MAGRVVSALRNIRALSGVLQRKNSLCESTAKKAASSGQFQRQFGDEFAVCETFRRGERTR